MKVAALQMVSSTRWDDNRAQAWQLLQQAAQAGAELAVLPEYFCLMGRQDTDKLALAEDFGSGPMQQFLADSARALGVWIVGGTLPLRGPDAAHVYNSSCVFNPQGDCAARYDKIHLFATPMAVRFMTSTASSPPAASPCTLTCPAAMGRCGAWV